MAWLLHNKILRAMADREEAYLLRGKIQIDDAYLGGELPCGQAGWGSENKNPIGTGGKHPSDLPLYPWITGSTICWATSRPASKVPSIPPILTNRPDGTSSAPACASTGAPRWRR